MKPDYRLTWVLPSGERREVDAYRPLNLLAHAELIELDLPQRCGGQAECGTCRVRILAGDVSGARGDEVELTTRHRKRFGDRERLACRARPLSDVTVEVLAVVPPDLRDVDD